VSQGGAAYELGVLGEQGRVQLGHLLAKLGRTVNVGEHQRDGPAG
jgi:hypothetical protein